MTTYDEMREVVRQRTAAAIWKASVDDNTYDSLRCRYGAEWLPKPTGYGNRLPTTDQARSIEVGHRANRTDRNLGRDFADAFQATGLPPGIKC